MTDETSVPDSAESPSSTPRLALTPQQRELSSGGLAAYRRLAVGDSGVPYWLLYEFLTAFAPTPGILGFGMRAYLYPLLFGGCGSRPAIGPSITLRNPRRIFLGDRVLIDDNASLDVRGADGTIRLGDRVSVGRLTTITAKHGQIEIGAGSNIGSYCRLATQSRLTIGKSVLIAAYCYIGPGNHQPGDAETPLIEREMQIKGGVSVGDHAWIGTKATILDGVSIGRNAIVGAHSLVRENVADGDIVAGSPARVIGKNNIVS